MPAYAFPCFFPSLQKDSPALQHPPQTRIITEKELWEEASKAYQRGLQAGREESRDKNHTRESTANIKVDGVDKTLSSVDAVAPKTADLNSSSSDPSLSPCSSVPLREPCPSYPAIPSSKPHLGRRRPGECVGPRGSVWDERGFNYFPNRDMFFPYEEEDSSFRSLVIFTAGRSAMENIDNLVRSWGFEHFDYVLMHYDDSSSEWNRYGSLSAIPFPLLSPSYQAKDMDCNETATNHSYASGLLPFALGSTGISTQ